MSAESRRLALALLLSLLMHALILSLTFGGQAGLPGFAFPWRERRIEAPDLRVLLVPAQDTAVESAGPSVKETGQQTPIAQPDAGAPTLALAVTPAPTPGQTAEAIVPKARTLAPATPVPGVGSGAASAKVPLLTEGTGNAAPAPTPAPAVVAIERPNETVLPVPAAPSLPTPVIAASPGASSSESSLPAPRDGGDVAQERIEQEARARVIELARLEGLEREAKRQAEQREASRIESARLDDERQVAARQEAARQEASRQEAANREAERIEIARREAERLEVARRAASRQEAARQEAEQLEAARLEAARQEASRQEAANREAERAESARREAQRQQVARQEAERVEAVRQAADQQEAARLEAARAEEARREARLRAIGRQLDEEAAKREAASTAAGLPSRLPPASGGGRRGRLFGRTDPNAELIRYAEAWARKIELNMTFDMVREAAKRPHTNPLVTVAIRSDGSVESVTFVTSSGVAEIDEAIRRIVQNQAPYQVFPPGLVREFDVIEIRRTWHFDMAIRLY